MTQSRKISVYVIFGSKGEVINVAADILRHFKFEMFRMGCPVSSVSLSDLWKRKYVCLFFVATSDGSRKEAVVGGWMDEAPSFVRHFTVSRETDN
jgi:hypothetical protein